MGYYQGDFYRGDYYAGTQGDPGFFSFLGGLAKRAVGMIPGVGPVASTALATIGGRSGGTLATRGMMIARGAGKLVRQHPVLSGAAAAGALAGVGAGVAGIRKGRMGVPGMRKRRRMHVTNVRALRRAIRRCTGFAHLAKRVLRFTSPRPPRGRAVFRAARRRTKKICA